jgi:hypothetical protein
MISLHGLRLLRRMTNNFELEAMRVEPIRGVTALPVLRKLTWLVKDLGVV